MNLCLCSSYYSVYQPTLSVSPLSSCFHSECQFSYITLRARIFTIAKFCILFFVLSQQKGTKILFETNTDLRHLVSETLNLSEHNYNSYIQGRNRIILIVKSTVKSPNPQLKLLFLRLSYNAPYASACLLPDLEKKKKRKLNWLGKDFN